MGLSSSSNGFTFSLPFLGLRAGLGRYWSRAGQRGSLQSCPELWQFRHLRLQSQMPATVCFLGQRLSCSSEGCAPPHLKHLTESWLNVQTLDALLCPSAWQREHCINAGLSIHFRIVISFPKRAALLLMSVEVTEPSGSEIVKVTEE